MVQGRDARERAGALIVGASSGIGAALARRLVADGQRVALVARSRERLDALCAELNAGGQTLATAYAHDVRDYDDAPGLLARIAGEVAPLRLVVYAAGILPAPSVASGFDDDRATIETNLTGAMRWLGLAADHLARQGGGTLVAVSSVAGDRGRLGNAAYMASKAGLSIYAEALRFRLRGSGVRVVTVKPGWVATPMVAGRPLPARFVTPAATAAREILAAARRGRPVAYVPAYWGPIMWVVRHLPAAVVGRLPAQ
jgi:short-subunit dehydrogenase